MTAVIELLKQHHENDDNITAFEKNLKIFVVKMDKLLVIMLCVMKNANLKCDKLKWISGKLAWTETVMWN